MPASKHYALIVGARQRANLTTRKASHLIILDALPSKRGGDLRQGDKNEKARKKVHRSGETR